MRWADPPSAIGKASWIFLAAALAAQAGCGVAERAGRGAAEGTIEGLAGKAPSREDMKQLAEGMKRRAAGGVIGELSRPEPLDNMRRIASAVADGTVAGASRAAADAPVEAIAARATGAFSRQMTTALGRTGEGPLAESLAATTEQVTASMARGAGSELSSLFPVCQGADAASCLDRAIERASRASTAGVAAGIRDALGIWPLVLAAGLGAFAALFIAWAWAIYRARHATAARPVRERVRHPDPHGIRPRRPRLLRDRLGTRSSDHGPH